VYVCLWAHDFHVLRQWKGGYSLYAYLRTVITRLVWERLSHLHPRGEVLTDDPMSDACATHAQHANPETPERLACAYELVRIVCSTLDRLNAQDRRLVELRYFHDLSYREIANVLGITTTHAGVRLARALGRLRGLLSQSVEETDVSQLVGLSFAEVMVSS
jgi:RNA polymerase sigma factor (sigma-70 family)